MSETITKDQAVDAMLLWQLFSVEENMTAAKEKWLTEYTASGARYAMIEMAAEVAKVLNAIPEPQKASILEADVFQIFVLDHFDYTAGPVPKLKASVEETAAWFIDEFGLEKQAIPGM